MKHNDVLLIHMGGLGDMCLSESTFLSLSRHFEKNISALGYSRFFIFFQGYFKAIHSIESAKWLYLFSDCPSESTWKRIAFIGKDRNGDLRRRWQAISEEELIFIDMYPDSAFDTLSSEFGVKSAETEDDRLLTRNSQFTVCDARKNLPYAPYSMPHSSIYVEDYQLMQLDKYGIRPVKKDIQSCSRNRVILYPEVGVTKSKWHHENFIALYHALTKRSIEVYIFESFGMNLPITDKIVIEDLADVRAFFDAGGIFVSNDSGMAHFAGFCGLFTITIFNDFDPTIWHPRGENISLRSGIDNADLPELEKMIFQLMDDGNDKR